ncbi:MAG: FIST C-terminal domain-containing protein [Bacteroidia bacterium]|nr:FIST C-terminal domain-containing protein [Bacteroidia bacterium]
MKIEQIIWQEAAGWSVDMDSVSVIKPQLVLAFGGKTALKNPKSWNSIQKRYPGALLVSCTTSGEIFNTQVLDESISLTALEFEKTRVDAAKINLNEVENRYEAGKMLGQSLQKPDLKLMIVISDGKNVNGSELVRGLNEVGNGVPITGGLAGDGDRFESTLVGLNEIPEEDNIVAISFYGQDLKVGYGSMGGWDTFGPERLVTHSEGNILYKLDDQPALELYKKYLGPQAAELPGSGLRFPLNIKGGENGMDLVRTIVGIDEEEGALIFAGDIPQGSTTQLMKVNFTRLVDGAVEAAGQSIVPFQDSEPEFALLVSCVGRKLLLGEQIEDEVEEVREVLGEEPAMAGFYSYGEISPGGKISNCQLHNQTMTITTLSEK